MKTLANNLFLLILGGVTGALVVYFLFFPEPCPDQIDINIDGADSSTTSSDAELGSDRMTMEEFLSIFGEPDTNTVDSINWIPKIAWTSKDSINWVDSVRYVDIPKLESTQSDSMGGAGEQGDTLTYRYGFDYTINSTAYLPPYSRIVNKLTVENFTINAQLKRPEYTWDWKDNFYVGVGVDAEFNPSLQVGYGVTYGQLREIMR